MQQLLLFILGLIVGLVLPYVVRLIKNKFNL
jgi:hypothetical protein